MRDFKQAFANDLRQYNPTAVIVSPMNTFLDDIIQATAEAEVLLYFATVKNEGFTFAFGTPDGAIGFQSDLTKLA